MAAVVPAPGRPAVRTAAFTIVRDEHLFLPIWLGYYSRHFDDLVILDHYTLDGSVERAKGRFSFRHVRLDYPYFLDFDWITEVVEQTQRELLHDHDAVLFTDPDEMLWHEDGLGRYARALARDLVAATAWEVVQLPDEGPLDPTRPVLAQRRAWWRDPMYDKPLLARVPVRWATGFHGALRPDGPGDDPDLRAGGPLEVPRDERLLLLHLHYVDFDQCRRKNARNATYPLLDRTIDNGWGRQCCLTGAELEDHLRFVRSRGGEPMPESLLRDPPF